MNPRPKQQPKAKAQAAAVEAEEDEQQRRSQALNSAQRRELGRYSKKDEKIEDRTLKKKFENDFEEH